MRQTYKESLGLTSQFYFCGLPLRLDTEPRCGFSCLYCFSKSRGGANRARSAQIADSEVLRRRLVRVAAGKAHGAVDEMLARRAAIHFGGMSDPFGRRAEVKAATGSLISVLADYGYPTVISTKGLHDPNDGLIADLRRGRFLVQFSFSTIDDELGRRVEVGCVLPSRRLAAMRQLADAGIPVSARLQPLLPGGLSDANEVIHAVAEHGAVHVGVEHLKVALEKQWPGTAALSRVLGRDARAWYRERGARRVGRELVLPVDDRLPVVLALRQQAYRLGVTFGAADTDLLLLSDGECCCSGADLHGVTRSFNRYTYTQAVRRSPPDRITLGSLRQTWAPEGSIAHWVNSKTRLEASSNHGQPLATYVRHNWNGRPNGPSPRLLWGVKPTGDTDRRGFVIYGLTHEAQSLTAPGSRRRASAYDGDGGNDA